MLKAQDFSLLHNDRVLVFHAFVNTDRDHMAVARELLRAARSTDLEASGCCLEGWDNGAEKWTAVCQEKKIARPALQHANRVIAFHIYVNTDRDPYHIHKAILRIARGPRLDACVVWSELYEGADGRKVWSVVQAAVKHTVGNPNAVPFDLG